MNFKGVVNRRPGGKRALNYTYFTYTLLCGWTNIRRLQWTDFVTLLSVQRMGEKKELVFADAGYDRLYPSTK